MFCSKKEPLDSRKTGSEIIAKQQQDITIVHEKAGHGYIVVDGDDSGNCFFVSVAIALLLQDRLRLVKDRCKSIMNLVLNMDEVHDAACMLRRLVHLSVLEQPHFFFEEQELSHVDIFLDNKMNYHFLEQPFLKSCRVCI